MIVEVKQNACIGCGICTDLCHETFEMGDDNKAHVRREPDASHESCALEAVDDCPTDAILVYQ